VREVAVERRHFIAKHNELISLGKYEFEDLPCLCCNAKDEEVLYLNDRYGIFQRTVMCKSCGFVYGNPRMSPSTLVDFYGSDLFREIYHTVSDYNNKWRKAGAYEVSGFFPDSTYDPFSFIAFIEKFAAPYNSVFEVGAAGGANLQVFKKMGKKTAGFDLSPQMVDFAQSKGLDVTLGTIEEIEGTWDIYVIQHVLEHVYDPVNFLQTLYKKQAKQIYIGVPGIIDLFPSVQSAHNFYFSISTLREICRKAGFVEVKIDYYKSNNYIVGLFKRSEKIAQSTHASSAE